MNRETHDILTERERSNWVRLRTLVLLRWAAICGQVVAVIVATRLYGVQLAVGPVAMVIGASIIANLFSSFLYPGSKRLSEREATVMLSFDVVQLSVLLYLTGGLTNPFALLILAPVTIAATVLHLGSTAVLGALAMVLITVIAQVSIPLIGPTGAPLMLPPLFLFGFWVSLMIGVVFLAIYARQVTTEMHAMGDALLATQLALAREQKLTDLGGVVAAAAHELGTPLATIKLVSAELMDDLDPGTEQHADARLIGEQADRCRLILRSMGRAGKDDLQLRTAPLETVVQEAAEPHRDRGRTLSFTIGDSSRDQALQPVILRRPEIIHGLRNLIQNAVDFADERVQIEANWDDERIIVRITDDGDGFPQNVISRIGDPFVRRRRGGRERPGYEGMGLGLFIAKTLLERSGAELTFANKTRDPGGAVVTVRWPRRAIDAGQMPEQGPLGENKPITV